MAVAISFAVSCTGEAANEPEVNKNVIPIAVETAEVPSVPESEETACKICDFDFEEYKGQLKREEIEGLLLALNDEYLAWATYELVNKDFNDPRPFVNIQKAEGRHIEELKVVFKAYEIPVPENKWVGDVTRYKSLAEACQAGVAGEIANRDLYTKLFNSTEREDIITVYKALQSASEENHLPAFQRCLGTGGTGNGPGMGRGRGRTN